MSRPLRLRFPEHVREVASSLKCRYMDFSHHNLEDPLDELLFIICSIKTEEPSYRASFLALKAAFPTAGHLAEVPAEDIAETIARGGFSNMKSRVIRGLLDEVSARFSSLTLEPLRGMSDLKVEAFLTSLPGIGKKIARS